jgi:hypothetical protein
MTPTPQAPAESREGENPSDGLGQNDGPGTAAVKDLAGQGKGEKPSEAQISSATDWFLSDDPEDISTLTFELNVASPDKPQHMIRWTVQALDRDRIRAIRRMNTRTQGTAEVEDEMAVNLRVAAEGTIDPDLSSPEVRGKYVDAADALRARLKHKPGLIDLIAGRVMRCSGYDQGDVVEVEAGKD